MSEEPEIHTDKDGNRFVVQADYDRLRHLAQMAEGRLENVALVLMAVLFVAIVVAALNGANL